MKSFDVALNPNDLVRFLKKPAIEFTRNDLMLFCEEMQIEMVNFRYLAEDGRLKTLSFAITSRKYLETILSRGERVDGSSLFAYMESGNSDLYVVPRYRTAFLNPFTAVPTLDIFCSFYNHEGRPLESDPGYILRRAGEAFTRETGFQFLAMGELEYYVMAPREEFYRSKDQKGYHASGPFAKFEYIRNEAMRILARTGSSIKYGHAEVGCFTDGDTYYEQHEIEFLPAQAVLAAEQIVLAKWILRKLGHQYGVRISFAPKIHVGQAGSGLHFHMLLEKDGENLTAANGQLSDLARKMIAGILDSAGALTAFGNTLPTSYLRLVPHQEAPTRICWGESNRLAVVRVPLSWTGAGEMIQDANPNEARIPAIGPSEQTFEFRVPDGSADIYLTLAGLVVAALRGLTMPDALELAAQLYVDADIFKPEQRDKLARLRQLPRSCWESAEALNHKREIFENGKIFPHGLIDSQIEKLKSYGDRDLSERLNGKTDEIKALVEQFIAYI
ncbi:MAG TPA: glutamine synthetase [Bacteroides sp.]|nr:glutamine synthetase [Bacteroides sp.]